MNDKIKAYWLTVNRECELRCGWCYIKGLGYKKKNDLDIDLAFNMIDVMDSMGTKVCKILGGEPALYPNIIPLLEYLKKKVINQLLLVMELDMLIVML